MPADPIRTVAAFDVDGTLTTGDCVLPFLRRVGGPWRLLAAIVSLAPVAVRTALGRLDRDDAKARLVRVALRGRDAAAVVTAGEAFAAEIERDRLRADTLARLRWHQRAGHAVVLVSASLAPYLEPLGARLGVDAVLCTRLVTHDGRLTGELDGPNCRGPEKAARLLAWSGGRPDVLYAYGDSSGDDELLALADLPHRLGKGDRLAEEPSHPAPRP